MTGKARRHQIHHAPTMDAIVVLSWCIRPHLAQARQQWPAYAASADTGMEGSRKYRGQPLKQVSVQFMIGCCMAEMVNLSSVFVHIFIIRIVVVFHVESVSDVPRGRYLG